MPRHLKSSHPKPSRLFLFIAGVPRPLPRPRMVGGPGGGHVVSYRHDKLAAAWADLVEDEARRHPRPGSWDPAARVTVEMMFTLPAGLDGDPAEPDWDNLAKLACDALQRSGVIANDRQIVRAMVGKQFTRDGAYVGMAVVIDADGQEALALAPGLHAVGLVDSGGLG